MNPAKRIVLLADDDLDDLELLEEGFQKVDHTSVIRCFSTAKEVLSFLQNCPETELPSLMIIDYNMPDISGADLIQLVYASTKFQHIPAVIWSTSNSPVYKKISHEKGARYYFLKPDNFQAFIDMAQQMLSFSRI